MPCSQRAIEAYGAAPPRLDVADNSGRMDEWPFKKVKRCPANPESEVDKYLAEEVIDEDILAWWKKHHTGVYPCLASAHRTRLPCHSCNQCSIHPSERVGILKWSQPDHRWSLEDNIIQACLCLKSWLS